MSASAEPLFPYLIDAPEDGMLEEHGWLPLSAAADEAAAVAEFARLYVESSGDAWWEEAGLVLVCAGKEWLQARYSTFDDDGQETEYIGADAERVAVERNDTSELRWGRCGSDVEWGAEEWWRVEVADQAEATP